MYDKNQEGPYELLIDGVPLFNGKKYNVEMINIGKKHLLRAGTDPKRIVIIDTRIKNDE